MQEWNISQFPNPFSKSRPLVFTPVEETVARIYQLVMGCVFLFAIITNTVAIRIFLCKSYGSLNTAKVLYASISFSDVAFLLTSLVQVFIGSNGVVIRMTYISGYVSTYTMALIAIHRYRAVAFPMQNLPNKPVRWHIILSICLIWILSTILGLGSLKYVYNPRLESIENQLFLHFCVPIVVTVEATKGLPYFALISMVCIPLGVGTVFSTLAIVGMRKSSFFESNVSPVLKRNKLRSTIMILVVICTFALCWIPISVFIAVEGGWYEDRRFCDYNYFLYLSLVMVLMVEFIANPIIYWAMNPTFRKGVDQMRGRVKACMVKWWGIMLMNKKDDDEEGRRNKDSDNNRVIFYSNSSEGVC